MRQSAEIVPIILSAGASTRMGRPKALLDFDGQCCLELVLDAVRGLGRPIVVLGADREEIQARVRLDGVQVVRNDEWHRGQTSSVKMGLAGLPDDAAAFLLFPVDYPLVTSADVGRLVETFKACDEPIVVPAHGERHGHPVVCRRDIAAELLALPDGAAARSVIKSDVRRIRLVPFERTDVVRDLDTPDDYRVCLDAYRARSKSSGADGVSAIWPT